jgi:hypothetical protein
MAFRIKIPDIMPVLSHGGHENPAAGACFMEYTSLLAGERFSDRPQCVDIEISSIMMWINDSLPDVDRHLLIPFLGRGIGLIYPRHPRPIPKSAAAKMTPMLLLATKRRLQLRVTRWEEKALEFRTFEVMPRVAKMLPELTGLSDAASSFATGVTHGFACWSMETGNRLIPTEEGRHEDDSCYNSPEPCRHHLDPAHRAGVDMLVRVADAVHTAYEDAMEARGWRVKREPACDLPEVMRLIPQGQ